MNLKIIGIAAAIAASVTATTASAQTVTPEQVLKLPVGTKYVLPSPSHNNQIARTAKGFTYSQTGVAFECNNVTRAGGRGNATINCTSPTKMEFRFEWLDINRVKIEIWANMAAKAGQTQHKAPQLSGILVRK
jgi:hypothetical protein